MSDDEIKALRQAYVNSSIPHRDICALADEALARGAEIAQLSENRDYAVGRLNDIARALGMGGKDHFSPDAVLRTATQLRERVAQLETALREATDAMDTAWGVIANAGGGDWKRETVEWRDAAARWRGRWYECLEARAARPAEKP